MREELESTGVETGNKETEPEHPDTLDVIKINGRWAQFFHTGMFGDEHGNKEAYMLVKWLDSRESEHILIKDVKGKSYFAKIVRDIKDQLSEVEYSTIHWGPEEKEDPNIRDLVTVWGEFE